MSDTNATIARLLSEGEAKAEVAQLAAKHDVHTLMFKLKEVYEKLYGKIHADMADWHWHATKLRNEHANADDTSDATTLLAADYRPIRSASSEANIAHATADSNANTVAPLQPVNADAPSIGLTPKPGSPEFLRATPTVTTPDASAPASVPGSPATDPKVNSAPGAPSTNPIKIP